MFNSFDMCLAPYPRRYTDYLGIDRVVDCPCGHCIECVKSIQDAWKCRLIEEDKVWRNCFFFTLTYRNSSLPLACDHSTGELISTACKSDVQKWLKRFRTNYYRLKAKEQGVTIKELKSSVRYSDFKPKFTYFICAEYGPNGTHRPHYHGLLFTDLPVRDVLPLFSDWRKRFGYVKFNRVKSSNKSVNKASAPANYVSKYCCKGEFASRVSDINAGLIEKAWRIMSKNIGAAYLTDEKVRYHRPSRRREVPGYPSIADACVDRLRYHDGQYLYKLPRYYKERIFYDVITENRLFVGKVKEPFGDGYLYSLVSRPVKRRAVRNTLPLEMQNVIRARAEKRYLDRFREYQSKDLSLTDSEIHLLLAKDDVQMVRARKVRLLSQANKFYNTNSLKNKYL